MVDRHPIPTSPVLEDHDVKLVEQLRNCVSSRTLYFLAWSNLSQWIMGQRTGNISLRELYRRHSVLIQLVGENQDRIAKMTALPAPSAAPAGGQEA